MHFYALIPAFLTAVSAHGVVLSVEGANGVSMPGLSSKLFPSRLNTLLTSESRRWHSP